MSQENFFNLNGQVAVVTGGGQGIGEGIARRLGAAGATVAVLDLRLDTAQTVAASIGGVAVECDVRLGTSVARAVREVHDRVGGIDILINNAGITGRSVPLWELSESELDDVYAVNLKGVFLTRIIREKCRSDEFLIETKHGVTRTESFLMASVISKQLVRAKGRF